MVYSKENYNFPKIQGGGPTFARGGGVKLLIPMETYRTCHFPGGIRTPVSIWIWECDFFFGGKKA